MLKVVRYNLNHISIPKTSLRINLQGIQFSSRFGEKNYYYNFFFFFFEERTQWNYLFINYKNPMELKTLVRAPFHYFKGYFGT